VDVITVQELGLQAVEDARRLRIFESPGFHMAHYLVAVFPLSISEAKDATM
jgi:hypothetical protein